MNEERLKILKMIEEGTISADEGAKLLNASEAGEEHTKEDKKAKKKYGVRNFLGDAVEKIKHKDFDLTFGEYVEFDHNIELEEAEIRDLDLAIANGSLTIESSADPHPRIASRIKVYQSESEEEGREVFLSESRMDIQDGVLTVASPSKKVKADVHLYVPEQSYDLVKATLKNGALTLNRLTGDHLQLKTSNGKVLVDQGSGQTCKVEAGNGSITLKDGVYDSCEIDTINGGIEINGDIGKSDASAVSGSIQVNHQGTRAHTGFYKVATGSITVALPAAKQVDGILRTRLGKLNCQLDNYKILNDKNERMNKLLEFEAFEEYEDTFHVEAETKTGSVTLTPAQNV